jgi:hypothetical protein
MSSIYRDDSELPTVIDLRARREIKKAETEDLAYKAKILTMSKVELLNEMVVFQEERSRQGVLSAELMVKGKILFAELEKVAETDALRALTRSYRRHLELEMKDYLKTGVRERD